MRYLILLISIIATINCSPLQPLPQDKPFTKLNLTVEVNYTWDNGCDQAVTVKNFTENTTHNINVGTCD